MTVYQMAGFDGKTISIREWAADNPKAIVLIAHGMSEHSLRYERLANKLLEEGYTVVCDDHRANGLTDKDNLGYSEGDIFNATLSDMAQLCRAYREKYPDKKIILFGHSYGSFLSQRFIEEHNDLIDGVILGGSACMKGLLSSAGLLVANIGYACKGEKATAKLLNDMTFESYKKALKADSFISTIPEEAKRYDEDELCGFINSYAFYKFFFKGLKAVYKRKNLDKLRKDLPILIISGDTDPVGEYGKSTTKLYNMYLKEGVLDVSLKLYKGVYHEYLNDVSKDEATQDILDFLNKISK